MKVNEKEILDFIKSNNWLPEGIPPAGVLVNSLRKKIKLNPETPEDVDFNQALRLCAGFVNYHYFSIGKDGYESLLMPIKEESYYIKQEIAYANDKEVYVVKVDDKELQVSDLRLRNMCKNCISFIAPGITLKGKKGEKIFVKGITKRKRNDIKIKIDSDIILEHLYTLKCAKEIADDYTSKNPYEYTNVPKGLDKLYMHLCEFLLANNKLDYLSEDQTNYFDDLHK